jgi:hypothetical protein
MKRPSKVIIGGLEYSIKYDPKRSDGAFFGNKYQIIIGTKYVQDVRGIFLHEIIEAIITERGFRWRMYNDSNEKMLFAFNHSEFEAIVRDVALALKDTLNI